MAHKKTAIGVGVIVLLLLVLGGWYFSTLQNPDKPESGVSEEVVSEKEEKIEIVDTRVRGREVDASELSNAQELGDIDLEAALNERVLGNPDAPIKISEHSSFSCGHCGNFHKNVFGEFKANWIDTGKAYLVFSDFPLNAAALRASMAARCVKSDSQYFDAVEDLFANQKDWAYESDYLTPMKAILAKYGVDSDLFKACVQNKELETGILDRIRAAQQQYGVNSTPTFVVNNSATVAGGATYEQFNQALEAAIAQSNAPADEAGTP